MIDQVLTFCESAALSWMIPFVFVSLRRLDDIWRHKQFISCYGDCGLQMHRNSSNVSFTVVEKQWTLTGKSITRFKIYMSRVTGYYIRSLFFSYNNLCYSGREWEFLKKSYCKDRKIVRYRFFLIWFLNGSRKFEVFWVA